MKPLFLVLALLAARAHASSADWTWDDPQPQGNALFAAAVSTGPNPVVVAVGEYGTVIRSVSAGTWTSYGPVANGLSLQGVVWSGDRFFASGFSAGLWSSSDGLAWSLVDDSVRAARIFRAGSKLIALNSSTAWVSSGSSFTAQPLTSAGISSFRDAASDGSRVLLYGSGGFLATSSDGQTWSKSPQNSAWSFYAAGGGSSGFLVGGIDANSNGILLASPNGSTWSTVAPPAGRFIPIRIFRLNNAWLVQDYWSGAFYRRDDSSPAQWARVESDLPDVYPSACVVSEENRMLFFGDRGLVAKLDGAKIVPELSGAIDSAFLYYPRFSAAAAGNFFAAIDGNVASSRAVRYFHGTSSSSGIAWRKPVPAPVLGLSALSALENSAIIGYSGGVSGVAADNLPATDIGFYRTFDGLSWQAFGRAKDQNGDPLLQGQVVSIAARPDEKVAVVITRSDLTSTAGYEAVRAIYRTTNWSDWQQISLPAFRAEQPASEENIESVVWDGSQFVMLLHPGRIFTSADGLSWTQLPLLPAGLAAVSVASGSGIFVVRTAALRSDGTYSAESSGGESICVFKDGRWWPRGTGRRAPVLQRRIIFAHDTFVASGEGAEILTSTDGFSWHSHSAPGAAFALLWNGTRLAALNDSFAAFSREGLPSGGTPLAIAALSPRSKSVPAGGETYDISLDIADDKGWTVSKIPSWMTVSPSSGRGPARLSVVVAANTGKSLRGAALDIGGESHFVLQQAVVSAALPPAVLGTGAVVSFPFAGDWSIIAAPPGSVSTTKGVSSGKGMISLVFARNNSVLPRTITVNINGTDYSTAQPGLTPVETRVGSYVGPLGYVSADLNSGLLSSPEEFESFEGEVRLQISASKSGLGPCSVSLLWHDGSQLRRIRGMCSVDLDGKETEFELSQGDLRALVRRFSVKTLPDGGSIAQGIVRLRGVDFVFCAGKNAHASGEKVTSSRIGLSTFVLDQSAAGPPGVAGSYTLTADGKIKVFAVFAGGAKATYSASVWTDGDGRSWVPLSFALASSRSFVGGYFASPGTGETAVNWDLEGFADLKAPQEAFDDANANGLHDAGEAFTDKNGNGEWDSGVVNMWSRAGRYVSPPVGNSVLDWPQNGNLVVSAPDADQPLLTAEASFNNFGGFVFSNPVPANAKFSFNLNAKTGIVSGSLNVPNRETFGFYGVVNQRFQSQGRLLGFATKGGRATFSISPQ